MVEKTLQSPRSSSRELAIQANRWLYRVARYWLLGFSLLVGFYVGLPFFAPVMMQAGLEAPALVIYKIYSFLCHQLPQRSYFLFGPQFTYTLGEIQNTWQDTTNFFLLRQFIGTPEMGWKVAWSDRMVSMYTSALVFAWIWYAFRSHIPRIGWRGFFLLALPMAADGITHMISDFAGLGQGFRATNIWLAELTNQAFPRTFYVGEAWGSFNSMMRLLTGILFGAGLVWFGFPYVHEYFEDLKTRIRQKFARAGLPL